jgi:diaminohydroxyphosphoribosylaminopyrimidine deaminase/5-amino-6-(5-phosphoribosylamino)uracil reductase
MSDSYSLMEIAINEALASPRTVRPNPRVGAALLSKDGRIISAKHEVFGGPHAEVNLFKKADEMGIKIEGSTVAVTLEPCSHFGKTPPCADLLIKEKVKKLIIGLVDPFEKVSGQGIAKLQAAGIEVEIDVLKDRCEAINREWLFAQKRKRPFVTLKMATSLDGKFFSHSGASQWITGPEARLHAQQLRARVDAMISSWKTVLKDDPQFTARNSSGELLSAQPHLFILSRREAQDMSAFKISQRPSGAEWLQTQSLEDALSILFKRGLYDVMIEAGPQLSSQFLEASLVDEIWHYMGSQYLGGDQSNFLALNSGKIPGRQFKNKNLTQLSDNDVLLILTAE